MMRKSGLELVIDARSGTDSQQKWTRGEEERAHPAALGVWEQREGPASSSGRHVERGAFGEPSTKHAR